MFLLLLVGAALIVAQSPVPWSEARIIHIEGHANAVGDKAKLGACLIEKLQDQGPFTFREAAEDAQAVLTLDTIRIPTGSSRVLLGRRSQVPRER